MGKKWYSDLFMLSAWPRWLNYPTHLPQPRKIGDLFCQNMKYLQLAGSTQLSQKKYFLGYFRNDVANAISGFWKCDLTTFTSNEAYKWLLPTPSSLLTPRKGPDQSMVDTLTEIGGEQNAKNTSNTLVDRSN